MKKHRKFIVSFVVALLLFVSGGIYVVYQYGPSFGFYLVPPTPERDAMFAFNKITSKGIHTTNRNQKTRLKMLSSEISKKSTYKDMYPLLNQALKIKGGKHSSISTLQEIKKEIIHYKAPTFKVKNNILYVHLPDFIGSSAQAKKYATTIYHRLIIQKYNGIIIDLSNNGGGDIGPMLAGISPVIPSGKLFEIITSTGDHTKVTLKGSVVENMGTKVDLGKIKKFKDIPVAVILNQGTASSGELTALALQTNTNVKSFGTETAGYTSVNDTDTMYNGAQINITVGKIRINNGQVLFNDKIKPDVQSSNPVIQAYKWILAH